MSNSEKERRVRRVATVSTIGAVGCAVLSLVALMNSLDLYTNVRARDLRLVAETPPEVLGTCVTTLGAAAVDTHLGGFYVRQNRDRCQAAPEVFESIAALNVHALVHAMRGGTNSTTVEAALYGKIDRVVKAALHAARGLGRAQVMFSDVADAAVAAAGYAHVPSCETLYPNTVAEGSFDASVVLYPSVICNEAATLSTVMSAEVEDQTSLLLAICELQFSYGRSQPNSLALGLQDTRQPLEPRLFLWESEVGINSTSSWDERASVYTGLRYGMFLFYLTPACILIGMLIADSVLVVMAEASVVIRARTTIALARRTAVANEEKEAKIDIVENALVSIRFRTRLAVLQVLGLAVVVTAALVGDFLTFGREGTALARPYCDSNGWRSDEPNIREVELTLYLLGGAIVSVPVLRFLALRSAGDSPFADSASSVGAPNVSLFQRLTVQLVSGVSIGTLILVADTVILQIAFGVQWARGATGADPLVDGLKLYQVLRDFGESTIRLALSLGTMVSLLVGRWMFKGQGIIFFLVLVLWTAAASFLIYQLVTAESLHYLFEELYDAIRGESVTFGSSTTYCTHLNGWPRTYCDEVRYITVYTGVGLLMFSIASQLLMWLLDMCSKGQCCTAATGDSSVSTAGIPQADMAHLSQAAAYERAPLLSSLSLQILRDA